MSDSPIRSTSTLRKSAPAAAPEMRLAQLIRVPAAASPAHRTGEMVVEVGGARITIGAGVDVATVVLVLTMLGGRARSRTVSKCSSGSIRSIGGVGHVFLEHVHPPVVVRLRLFYIVSIGLLGFLPTREDVGVVRDVDVN